MYYKMSEEELRSNCRTSIENLERWGRLLIDKELKLKYGDDYFHAKENGEFIVKNEIRIKADKMLKDNPSKFPRIIDTLFLGEIIYFLCNPRF